MGTLQSDVGEESWGFICMPNIGALLCGETWGSQKKSQGT
jgi:hypothetical protein